MIAALLLQRMSARRRSSGDQQSDSEQKCNSISSVGLCCRTCLGTRHLVTIFKDPDDEKTSVHLKLVTGLEIKKDDGLPQKICKKCLGMINLSLQFRRKSKKAEKVLVERASKKLNKESNTSDINTDVKPKIKKAKVEREYYEDYEEVPFLDDFQNDDDYDSKEDVKPLRAVQEQASTESDRKRRQRSGPARLPPGPPYKCSMCGKEFKMKTTYTAHLRFHTHYCVCEACGKRCRNNNQLQEHKRAKHGLGRIHKCAYCEYSSATKEALTIHERRHTGERPYICDHCGATFHRRANLVQHIAIHLPEKNFQCDLCPKKLKSRKFLQIHKHGAHTGRRYGYLCSLCHHRFEKPNKCSFCPSREKSKKRLQIHIFKAHREKRYSYKCPRCLKLFQRNEHAHRHLARVHHIPRPEHPVIEKVLIHNLDKESSYKEAGHAGYRPAQYPTQYEAAAEAYRQAMQTSVGHPDQGLNLALM